MLTTMLDTSARDFRCLYVVAANEIKSQQDAQELLGNYDIDYWVRYVVEHIDALGRECEMVKFVLWTLLSSYSVYQPQGILLGSITQADRDKYRDMHCPVQQSTHRRRH